VIAPTAGARAGRSACVAPTPTARRGAVLLVVLAALVVLGLAAAALAVEARAARLAATQAVAAQRAFDAAAGRAAAAPSAWAAAGLAQLAVRGARADSATEPLGTSVARHVVRLTPDAALVTATAEGRAPGAARPVARRRVQLLVALEPAVPVPTAALTAAAAVAMDATTWLDGRDTLPAGWSCVADDSASVPAVAHAPDAPPSVAAATLGGSSPVVVADPALQRDAPPAGDFVDRPAVRAPAFVAAAPMRVASVTDVTIAPSTDADGACPAAADSLSWGDPRRPSACGGHLPLVHVAGTLSAPRGRGQGVLVVDGDLLLDGGFEFWGVVAVGGRLAVRGTGNSVVGALVLRARPPVAHDLAGLSLRWSSCVVDAALRAAGTVRPAGDRAWREGW